MQKSKRISDYDSIVMELSSKRENKDLLLPTDEDQREEFINAMKVKNYDDIFGGDDENVPFGKDCIIKLSENTEKENSA